MLNVISLEEAKTITGAEFGSIAKPKTEAIPLEDAMGRICAEDIVAEKGVPEFDRSTVDGYAVHAKDTFGCSEGLPAMLEIGPDVNMGEEPDFQCRPGICNRISTGGMLPEGADAVVMLEYVEEYGDGTAGLTKPVSPGDNVVYKYDDFSPSDLLIPKGTRLEAHHIGVLASLGISKIEVVKRPVVAIISSGDEIVPYDSEPKQAQMRDVNAPLLASLVEACGCTPMQMGIVQDDLDKLDELVTRAMDESDAVLVSGGTSASAHDGTPKILSSKGDLLFHGIAVKPGKPTLCASADGKPLFGLPGHPAAAYYVFSELVAPVLKAMAGTEEDSDNDDEIFEGRISESIPSNHGRAEFIPVKIQGTGNASVPWVHPVSSKSGLISQLLGCAGYITVPRDSEGIFRGATVKVKKLI